MASCGWTFTYLREFYNDLTNIIDLAVILSYSYYSIVFAANHNLCFTSIKDTCNALRECQYKIRKIQYIRLQVF